MPRKLFIIFGLILGLSGFTVLAAPIFRVERSLIPEVNDQYHLGTTTPSTNAWKSIITNKLCLAGNCQTSWPSGAATSTEPLMGSWLVATSTTAISTFAGPISVAEKFWVNPNTNTGFLPATTIASLIQSEDGIGPPTLSLKGGDATGGGFGGYVTIDGGLGSNAGYGGEVSLVGGGGGSTGLGGNLNLYGGSGGGTSGGGGDVVVKGGGATWGSGGNITFVAGTTGSGSSGLYRFRSPISGLNGIFNFDNINSSDKTFTFPNASGTLALLQNPQTWTGLQTFGNNISIGGAQFSISSLTKGDVVSYNGTNWVNAATSTLDINPPLSKTIEALAATDDNLILWTADRAVTLLSVGCRYEGIGTTTASIILEDSSGNAMTHANGPTCVTGATNATTTPITAGGSLVAGEGLRMDVTNSPIPETDTYIIYWKYKET